MADNNWGKDDEVVDNWGANDQVVGQTNPIMTGLRAVQDSAMLGFDDEVRGAMSALNPFGDGNMGDRYTKARDQARAQKGEFARDNPLSWATGQVAGAFTPASALAKGTNALTKGVTNIGSRIAESALVGGLMGSGQGAGSAETVQDVPRAANIGGVTGAAVGGAVPVVAAGGGKVTQFPKVKEFLQNYKDLAPTVTGKLGPVTVGGLGGAISPSVSGAMGGPGITPEDWRTDPYSSAMISAAGGLTGMGAGKGIQMMGRAGGALEQTMRGKPSGGPSLSSTTPPTPPVTPSATTPKESIIPSGPANPNYEYTINKSGSVMPQRKPVAPTPEPAVAPTQPTPQTWPERAPMGSAKESAAFDQMANYLTKARGASNPAVKQTAQQMEQATASGGENAQRVAAMNATSTPTGRAVSNTESVVREATETALPTARYEGGKMISTRTGQSNNPNVMGMVDDGYTGPQSRSSNESMDDLAKALKDPKGYKKDVAPG